MKFLKDKGVATGVHYIPNHIQPLFESSRQPLPVTEQVFVEMVTLPMYYELTEIDQQTVIDAVHAFFRKAI